MSKTLPLIRVRSCAATLICGFILFLSVNAVSVSASDDTPKQDGQTPTGQLANAADEGDTADDRGGEVRDGDSGAAADEPSSRKLRFNFRHQPWDDVLNWFAEKSDLSFALDVVPTGTFNYVDNASYTPAEALDLINSVLITKGYTLLRRNRMLLILDLEDQVDAQLLRELLTEVPLSELDKRGEFEPTKCRFTLQQTAADEVEKQVNQLLSPLGSIVVMPHAKQLLITETGGTLRTIREVIKSLEGVAAEAPKSLTAFRLKNATAGEVLAVAKPLLNIAEDASAAEDNSIRISADPLGTTVFATGTPEKIALVQQVVQRLDGDIPAEEARSTAIETPQLMAHRVSTADPDMVLRVLQTLLVGDPSVRLDVHPATGDIIAMARPSQHRAITATIAEMERHPGDFAVFPLRVLDPVSAVMLIDNMFGAGKEGANPHGPIVDLTLQPKQLVVRGTQGQIVQIRSLLASLGEDVDGGLASRSGRSNVRFLQIDPEAAQTALERIRQIWPRKNQIRMATPANPIRTRKPSQDDADGRVSPGESSEREPVEPRPGRGRFGPRTTRELGNRLDATGAHYTAPRSQDGEGEPPDSEKQPNPSEKDDERTGPVPTRVVTASYRQLVAQADTTIPPSSEIESADDNRTPESSDRDAVSPNPAAPADANADTGPQASSDFQPGDIYVAPGSGGLTIISDDTEALDTFETLLDTFSNQGSGARFNIFYLKHIGAEAARDLLNSIWAGMNTGTTLSSAATSSRSSNSDSQRGGVIGNLLRGGLSSGTGGSLIGRPAPTITADNRLNALFVQAPASDIKLIGQLLEVIDQESGPEEVLTFPKPKFIPVYYTSAESVAEVVRQVYANRIITESSNNSRGGFPRGGFGGRGGFFGGPGGFFGGRGGGRDDRGGGNQGSSGDEPKMTLGVDPGSNSLIVSAPGPLLKEVEGVVAELDRRAETEPGQDVAVVTLKRTNAELVHQSLANIFGDSVQSSGTQGRTTNGSRGSSSTSGRGSTPPGNRTPEEIQRRIEFFNALRGGGGFGGGGPQSGSDRGGRGGGGPGGGRSRGGR